MKIERPTRKLNMCRTLLCLGLCPMFLSSGSARGEILAQWDVHLTGGVGLHGAFIDYWQMSLIAPNNSQLFTDVQLNDSSSGLSYTAQAGTPNFDSFVASITDDAAGTIRTRRGPANRDTNSIVSGVYYTNHSELTVLGGGIKNDLAGARIDLIRMNVIESDLNNLGAHKSGNGAPSASYLSGDITYVIEGEYLPVPEPGSLALLGLGGLLIAYRRRDR